MIESIRVDNLQLQTLMAEHELEAAVAAALSNGDLPRLFQIITPLRTIHTGTRGSVQQSEASGRNNLRLRVAQQLTTAATNQFQAQNFDMALHLLASAVELDCSNFGKDIIETVIRFFMGSGRTSDAIQLLEQYLPRDPRSQEMQRLYCDLLSANGDYTAVTEHLQSLSRAIEQQNPLKNGAHVSLQLGWKESRLRDDLFQLGKDFFIPSSPAADLHGAEFYNQTLLASALFGKGQLGRAAQVLGEIIAARPTHATALYNLSLVHTLRGRLTLQESEWRTALQLLTQAVQSAPDWALAHYALGRLQIEGFGNWQEALISLTRSIAIDPTDERAFREAGEAQSRLTGFAGVCEDYYEQYLSLREARQNAHPVGRLGIRFLNWNNTYAFGHLLALPEMYRKLQLLGWIPNYNTFLCAEPSEIANRALFDLWGQHFNLVTSCEELDTLRPLIYELTFDTSIVRIPDLGAKRYQVAYSTVHEAWKAKPRPKFFTVPASLEDRGQAALARLGVPTGAWFVCVHMREAGFKQEGQAQFYAPRMVQPETYYPALRRIIEAGGYVVRLGEPSMTPLPNEPGMIDYARSSEKSDWMDLYLMSACRFYLVSATGSYGAGRLFEVPTLFTNWPILHALPEGTDDLFIYKLLRDKHSGQLLSFANTFGHPLFASEEIGKVDQHGHEFIDNTPEEIEAAVVEMLARTSSTTPRNINGVKSNSLPRDVAAPREVSSEPAISALQNQVSKLYPAKAGRVSFSVCESFLQRHAALL